MYATPSSIDASQELDILKTMWIGPSERTRVRGANCPTLWTSFTAYNVSAAIVSRAYGGQALVVHHLSTGFSVLFMVGDPSEVARGDPDKPLKETCERHLVDLGR